jgi:hypothetical protein
MKTTAHHDDRLAKMKFRTVYHLYLTKILKKNRTEDELIKVICWLSGFAPHEIIALNEQDINFEDFFESANLHPNASLISGSICGYKVQEIQNHLTQKIRFLDKLVDELAKGKSLLKILRV